jgi:Carboxypeptidase regulatory-like domain
MSRLSFFRLIELVIGLSALAAPAAAQTTAATLAIVIEDATGGRLPGATIVLTNRGTNVARTVTTNDTGRVLVAGLPPGEYRLEATLSGFAKETRDVRLSVSEQGVITLRMQLAGTDNVIVQAAPANARSTELSYLVESRLIERLPVNGRNFTDLIGLQPGVSIFPYRDNGSVVAHGLAMSVNGQDPRANVYLLDGTLLNDFTNGPAGSAAGTALGMDTVREFRVEANSYSAEFGRNVGGQINAITKSGTNLFGGSAFEYFRNDALDARNYFDVGDKPNFTRNQFGGTVGGPIRRNRLFYFVGYESLRENLGRTIVTTVPDDNARQGILPTGTVTIHPAIQPFLNEFPRANGENLGGGLARYTFPFEQRLEQHFFQGRLDAVTPGGFQIFGRYTVDDADQKLPTDYPQFPRAFISTNQFATFELRKVQSASVIHTARFGYSRTRIGQNVEANTASPLPVFVPGRDFVGSIDIGGFPRFGTQSSANLRLGQDVFSGQYDITRSLGRHLLKAGGLAEHYHDDELNPTFSLGIYRFANLSNFLRNIPASFIGLTPQGDFRRQWGWTLLAAYLQDDFQAARNLTLNLGLRLEGSTMPVDEAGRDINMPDLLASAPTQGPLYENPGAALSPRVGAAWDIIGSGKTVVRGGYGLYFNTNNQQNLIVTVTNPPATPRVVLANPTFPVPSFQLSGVSVRPIQNDVQWPRVHTWNVNVLQQFWTNWDLTIGYAGARGKHLWRNSDVNIPTPSLLPTGVYFYPSILPRPNTNFTAIELKSSDGNSWYDALIVDLRKRLTQGLHLQSSYTWSKAEDTTQNATFFSDSTAATTSAMPEFIPDYNKGLSDFHVEHSWVASVVWDVPGPAGTSGLTHALLSDWRVATIIRMRSGNPLTPMLQTNRSRSQWSPSLGPGTGPDRPSYAPGRGPDDAVTGDPARWFDPTAFVLQPAGTFGDVGRNELIGPDLRSVDLAISREFRTPSLGDRSRLDLRLEIFNVFNRANFGPPSVIAFAGTADNEAPLASFGQIRTTVTSARQAQLGVRLTW